MHSRFLTQLSVLALVGIPGLRANPDPLDTLEKTSAAWIELRAETVRLSSAWQSEQMLLDATIAALEDRAQAAEEERDLERATSTKDQEDLADLTAKISTGTADQKAFEERLIALDEKLVQTRPSLPPRLSDALEVSFTSLSSSQLSPGERIQLTVSVLNRCIQFDSAITATDEVLTMDGASEGRMFEVIYWGLSHGYAVDRAAHKAWYGSPGSKGWTWEARDDLAEPALRLIAIFNDQHDPEFVSAPARLSHSSGAQHP